MLLASQELVGVTDTAAQATAGSGLDAGCTISVLNRTAQVGPDGTWRIDNVPANFGPVRARATCVENGVTRSGQSGFLTIQAGVVTGFDSDITLGVVDPIPESLTITAPTTTLTAIGATVQLAVAARLPDGSGKDVTTASLGTAYTTSNATVATVGPDGHVAAAGSGTAIVSATNEGALGLIVIRVIASADSDGDAIPDTVELASGLDPRNPVDALEDFDDDALTNRQELVDYGTNPRLNDTDRDGISDGLEVQTGSDPNNPNSYNLAAALRSIAVSPASFPLNVNTVLGDVSRRLSVAGALRDGTTIDLTARARDVAYASSDLSVCSFGATPGEVFGGADGTCTITVTVAGHSAQATARVRTFAPTALSFIPIPGAARGVDVRGRHAYVAAGESGLQVVDVANPRVPHIAAALQTAGSALDVKVVGPTAYVAAGAAGLLVVDVANPIVPVVVGAIDTPGEAQGLDVKGNLVYVADGAAGLQLVDVGVRTAPRIVGSVGTPGAASGVAAATDRPIAVVAALDGGVQVVDVTNPSAPIVVGATATEGAEDVVVSGSYAFVASVSSGFTPIDIADPRNPVRRPSAPFDTGGRLRGLALVGRFAFGADVFFVNGVPILDVGSPQAPLPRAILDFSRYRDDDGVGVAADDNYVYLTAAVGDDSRLYVGQYRVVEDLAGVAPAVRIAEPAPGTTAVEDGTVRVLVDASDDVEVAAVELLVDGQVVATLDAPPYAFVVRVPFGATQLVLGARAVDQAGNAALATEVTVAVVAGAPRTTAVGRVVRRNGRPVAGAAVTCLGAAATTGTDGSFSLAGLPTTRGSVRCDAAVPRMRGASRGLAPVPGGETRVGDILVQVQGPLPSPMTPVTPTLRRPALADLNQDGRLDVVGFEPFQERLWVLSGRGDGTFGSEQAIGETHADAIVLADLDGDGRPDLVTADALQGEAAVRLALEGGAFGPELRYAVGEGPSAAAAADLDGDARLDLVVANTASSDVSVLLGGGDGTLRPQRRFGVGPGPVAVVVADLDGDGRPDLAVASRDANEVSVLLGNGDGTFRPERRFPVDAGPSVILTADLDADGRADLITVNTDANDVSVLLGNGDGTFRAGQPIAVGELPTTAAAGDLDRDGYPDLVVGGGSSDGVRVLLGNGNGTLRPAATLLVGPPQDTVRLADLDRDGRLDLFVLESFTRRIVTLRGQGDGTFHTPRRAELPISTSMVAAADFDGDGQTDVVVNRTGFPGGVWLLASNGDGSFRFPAAPLWQGFAQSIVAADPDRNGRPDLVVSTSGGLLWLPGNGDGTFGPERSLGGDASVQSLAAGDLDGDGLVDLVLVTAGSPDLSLLLGNGDGTFRPPRSVPTGDFPLAVAVADLDGDGRADLAVAHPVPREVAVLPGNGDGTFRAARRTAVDGGPSALAAADLDADLRTDLVVVSRPPGHAAPLLFALLGNGDASFGSARYLATEQAAAGVVAADLNGDALVDLVTPGFAGLSLFLAAPGREDLAGVAPAARIVAPPPGTTAVEGGAVRVVVEASDDVAVAAVELLVDGRGAASLDAPPFAFAAPVPLGATAMVLGARAVDLDGNTALAAEVAVAISPDPRTTAVGRVVRRNGRPVAGAAVTCLGVAGTSGGDGSFALPGVPTAGGSVRCDATYADGGVVLRGSSTPVPPIPGGTSAVADLVVDAPWVRVSPSGVAPSPRSSLGGDYDEPNDRLILFSGASAAGFPFPRDVWVLRDATGARGPATWEQLQPTNAGPDGRTAHTAVYDPTSNRLIVHGGCGGGCAPALDDTWVLSNANGLGGPPTWLQLPAAPVARDYHSAAYDVAGNRMIVFGGDQASGGTDRNDVLVLVDANGLGTPGWIQLTPAGAAPPVRIGAGTVYDPGSNRLVVFGGRTTQGAAFNDVWVLTNANGLGGPPEWLQLAPTTAGPSRRGHVLMAYDPATNRALVFGGGNGPVSTLYNDLWVLANANGLGGPPRWTLTPPGDVAPVRRYWPVGGYARGAGQLIVAMGASDQVPDFYLDEVWTRGL